MKFFMLAITLLLLNACVVKAQVGEDGSNGYYIGTGDRSAGTIAKDTSITALIKARFLTDSMVSVMSINVDTYNGVVTLKGNVVNSQVAQRASDIARSVKGVKSVKRDLTISR